MRRLFIISGAGLSVESGIPAFRVDTDSGKALWEGYDINEVCNIHTFNNNTNNAYFKTHEFYNKRRQELNSVKPNQAHIQIAKWYQQFPSQVINVTTNVDDLLERVGIKHDDILHVHGFLKEIVYKIDDKKFVENIGYTQVSPEDYLWVKPNVIFFGEAAPLYQEMWHLFDSITPQDLVILVGVSNQVINFYHELYPAVNLGTKLVVVNPLIPLSDRYQMEAAGIEYSMCGAVEAFSNTKLIKKVEKHLFLEDR
jgi:NAD-dependent deacetylase